jgi:hypothetical protein
MVSRNGGALGRARRAAALRALAEAEAQEWQHYTRALIRLAGGARRVADYLELRRQTPYRWSRVPEWYARALEHMTGGGITRAHWRPDLWGFPEPTPEGASYRGQRFPSLGKVASAAILADEGQI